MLKIKRPKITRPVPFIKLIPNLLTILGLVIGISSIRFALESMWEMAVYCVVVAAVIDGIDGKVARMLNATSPFGAELDSLCDLANFGLSPAFIVYLWSFQQYEHKVLSWAAMLLFIACMALRLARFNTSILPDKQDKSLMYFLTGVPAPCGALLILMPIILDFEISTALMINIRSHTILIDIYVIIVAFLLASRLPTISTKNLRIKPEYLSLAMIIFIIITINIIIYPWYSLPILALVYLISIPVCMVVARRLNHASLPL